jgi:hypothetical protein
VLPTDVVVLADDGRLLLEVRAPGRDALALAVPGGDGQVSVEVFDFAVGDDEVCRVAAEWLLAWRVADLRVDPDACTSDRTNVWSWSGAPLVGRGPSRMRVGTMRWKGHPYFVVLAPGHGWRTRSFVSAVVRNTDGAPYIVGSVPEGFTFDLLNFGWLAPIVLPEP